MRYSEVKQSVLGSNTITDSKHIKPSEPEYETIAVDPTLNVELGYDVKTDVNPAYQATSQLILQETKVTNRTEKTVASFSEYVTAYTV